MGLPFHGVCQNSQTVKTASPLDYDTVDNTLPSEMHDPEKSHLIGNSSAPVFGDLE